MKFATDRPYADPEKAARKIVEIANSVEPGQQGRIYIELINGPFLYREKGTPDEYKAGLDLAVERGWLVLHESGTFVKFTEGGVDLSPFRGCRAAGTDYLAIMINPPSSPAFRPRRRKSLTGRSGSTKSNTTAIA